MLRALVVDDHDVVRQGLRVLLTREFGPLIIEEAKDSQEAVERLIKTEWSIILLDISMPGRSGLDLLQDCKRLNPRTPVLIFSCYAEEDFALRAFRLGAAGYLNKQCSSDELMKAVQKLLDGGRYVPGSVAERMAEKLSGNLLQAPHEALSNRELQILCMVAMGKTLKDISTELALSEKTVGTYRSRISEKIGLATAIQLTRYAFHHGLVQ